MKLPLPSLALACACLLSSVLPATAQASVGARVIVQAWNPATPDQANQVPLVDEPGLVSSSLADAWTELRPRVCAELKGQLGVGGAAGGQTLYDIECQLDERARFEIRPAGQNTLAGAITVGGYLEATSTTPTPLGDYADPRVSIHVTARLELVIAIQPNRNETLRVSQARFTVADADLDSHNFSGDVLEFVAEDLAPFFGGPDFKRLAEQAINTLSLDFANKFNQALVPVNAVLVGPSDKIRVGVSASGGYVSVAFAPREFVPITTGVMQGTLRWNTAQFEPRNGCQSFAIRATVQTGPVPLYTANAEAPRREIGNFQASPAGDGACAFTLSGLAAGWPNYLSARIVDGNARAATGSRLYSMSYSLAGDGWDGLSVVPVGIVSPRDYRVSRSLSATAVKDSNYGSKAAVIERATDPRINPADAYNERATQRVPRIDVQQVNDGTRPGDDVSLNPQPLPPRPSDAASSVVNDRAAQSGIIIVSGRAGDPMARKSSSVSGLYRPKVDPVPAPMQVRSATAPATPEELAAMRNRNLAHATVGAAIAARDPGVAARRDAVEDESYRLGFDIASGIFGDPAQGADGNTLTGPGSMAIRDSLNAAAQRGFNDSVTYHLSRNYSR